MCGMGSRWDDLPQDFIAALVTSLAAFSDRATLKNLRRVNRQCKQQVDGNLQHIKLNYVTGELHQVAGQFPNLTHLDLTRVSPNQSPRGLSTLQRLSSLKLNGWLRSLSMAGHEDDEWAIRELSHLPSLTHIEGLVVRSNGLLALKGLTSLRSLKLHAYSNRFYGSDSAELSLGVLVSLHRLTSVSLIACELRSELGSLASHRSLTDLTLDGCRDVDFDALSALTGLRSLQLLDLQLFDQDASQLVFLAELGSLSRLHVCEPCTFSDHSGFLRALPPSLQRLDYHVTGEQDDTWVSTYECFHELTRLSGLTCLDAPVTPGVLDSGILTPELLPRMRKLGVNCREVVGARFRSLAALTTLCTLNLHSMEDIHERDLISVVSSLPRLSKLLLLDFHNMTSHCLSILQSFQGLTSIIHSRSFSMAWAAFRMSPLEPAFCPLLAPSVVCHPLGSYIGGQPYWPDHTHRPTCENCHRAKLFLIQLNLAASPLAERCGSIILQLFACITCTTLHACLHRMQDGDEAAAEDGARGLKFDSREVICDWKPVPGGSLQRAVPVSCWRSHGLVEVLESMECPKHVGFDHSWPPELSELPEILTGQGRCSHSARQLIHIWSRYSTNDDTTPDSTNTTSSPATARSAVEVDAEEEDTRMLKTVQIGGYTDPFCNLCQVMHSHNGQSHKLCPVCCTPMCFRLCSVSTKLLLEVGRGDEAWRSLHAALCRLGTTSFELCSCPYHIDNVVMQSFDRCNLEHVFWRGVEWVG